MAKLDPNQNFLVTKVVDGRVAELIIQIKKNAEEYLTTKNYVERYIIKVEAEMVEYQNFPKVLLSGQQLIDELRNAASRLLKLYNLLNDWAARETLCLETKKTMSERKSQSFVNRSFEYKDQYDLANNNVNFFREEFTRQKNYINNESDNN